MFVHKVSSESQLELGLVDNAFEFVIVHSTQNLFHLLHQGLFLFFFHNLCCFIDSAGKDKEIIDWKVGFPMC